MRAIALSCPPPALETCLRGTYRAFAQNSKFVSAASVGHIHFMGAAVIEMTRLDVGGWCFVWGSVGWRRMEAFGWLHWGVAFGSCKCTFQLSIGSSVPHNTAPPPPQITPLKTAASYQLAFGAVRQLGVLLRNSLTMKTADAFKEVYCWQVGADGWGRIRLLIS